MGEMGHLQRLEGRVVDERPQEAEDDEPLLPGALARFVRRDHLGRREAPRLRELGEGACVIARHVARVPERGNEAVRPVLHGVN